MMDPVRTTRPTCGHKNDGYESGFHEADVHDAAAEMRSRAALEFLARSLAWEQRLTVLREEADGPLVAAPGWSPNRAYEAA